MGCTIGCCARRRSWARSSPATGEWSPTRRTLTACSPTKDSSCWCFRRAPKGTTKPWSQRYRLQRFGRGGFIEVAMRAGVPVLPVAITGTEEAMPALFTFEPRRGTAHPGHRERRAVRSRRGTGPMAGEDRRACPACCGARHAGRAGQLRPSRGRRVGRCGASTAPGRPRSSTAIRRRAEGVVTMHRVLLTGASTPLGRAVAVRLKSRRDVNEVVTVDVRDGVVHGVARSIVADTQSLRRIAARTDRPRRARHRRARRDVPAT